MELASTLWYVNAGIAKCFEHFKKRESFWHDIDCEFYNFLSVAQRNSGRGNSFWLNCRSSVHLFASLRYFKLGIHFRKHTQMRVFKSMWFRPFRSIMWINIDDASVSGKGGVWRQRDEVFGSRLCLEENGWPPRIPIQCTKKSDLLLNSRQMIRRSISHHDSRVAFRWIGMIIIGTSLEHR